MKRFLDIMMVLVTAAVWLPVLAGAAVAVFIAMGRPVFFVQERAGLGGRPFRLVKLRTMRGGTGTDAERLTRLGAWLRATSLDELPELWNVLKGEMSLVGPRPLLMRYLPRYSPEQARRHEVRPGLTGLAQVNGRNALTWERKFEYDVWYVDHRSLWLDVKILWLTVWRVAARQGTGVVCEFYGDDSAGAMSERIRSWLSPENLALAHGKTRDEIFSLFGNELEPIARVPQTSVGLFGHGVEDGRVFCGKGYFIDHAVNHHPNVRPEEYGLIQGIIDDADDVKVDMRGAGVSLVFVKKMEQYGAVVVGVGCRRDGRIILHKTFFTQKKEPYARLPRAGSTVSPVDGISTISHAGNPAPAVSLSALDDSGSMAEHGGNVNGRGRE